MSMSRFFQQFGGRAGSRTHCHIGDSSNQKVTSLDQDEASSPSESEAFITRMKPDRHHSPSKSSFPWRATTLFFAITSLISALLNILLLLRLHHHWQQPLSPNLLPTEGEIHTAVSHAGPLDTQRFTAGHLTFSPSGNFTLLPSPDGTPLWFGPPGDPVIECRWAAVDDAIVVLLEGADADQVRDRTLLVNGFWATGLDVMHQVHCLNAVRRTLVYPGYFGGGHEEFDRIHATHCLESVLQSVMCRGDAAPVRWGWSESGQRVAPDFAKTEHSCRDFGRLLEWSAERRIGVRKHGRQGGEEARTEEARRLVELWKTRQTYGKEGKGGLEHEHGPGVAV